MSGGVYNWAQGAVLDAADLNEFLGNQVIARFTNTAARTAAYGVVNAPALQAGLFAWTADDEKLYYYDGTSWEEVGSQVADGEITAAKIASDAVTTVKILDANVTAAKLASNSVTTVKILDANVTTAKILDANVTAAKLASGAAVSNVGFTPAPSELTLNAQVGTTYTLVLSDSSKFVTCSNASAVVVTVPPNSSVAFPTGTQVNIMMLGVGSTSISPGSGVTIRSSGDKYTLNAQYAVTTLLKIDTNTWVAIGNLKA